jgi:hypothetical protein
MSKKKSNNQDFIDTIDQLKSSYPGLKPQDIQIAVNIYLQQSAIEPELEIITLEPSTQKKADKLMGSINLDKLIKNYE